MSRVGRYLGLFTGATIALGGAAAVWTTRTESGFRWFLDRVYAYEFADVTTIEPSELALMMAEGRAPVLLDTRAAAEFEVSHLAGARHAPAGPLLPDSLAGVDRDAPVVLYCSIGYRSAKFARRLRTLGFRNVYNLYGGLFLWYNQGRDVVRDGRVVQAIHPYDALWGMFVTRDGKAYLP